MVATLTFSVNPFPDSVVLALWYGFYIVSLEVTSLLTQITRIRILSFIWSKICTLNYTTAF